MIYQIEYKLYDTKMKLIHEDKIKTDKKNRNLATSGLWKYVQSHFDDVYSVKIDKINQVQPTKKSGDS